MSGGIPATGHVGIRFVVGFTGACGHPDENLVEVDEPVETPAEISNDGLTGHLPAHHRAFRIHLHRDEPAAPAGGRATRVLASAPAATPDDHEHRE